MSAILQINLEDHLGKIDDKTLIETVVKRLGKEQTINMIVDTMNLSLPQVELLKTFLKGINHF